VSRLKKTQSHPHHLKPGSQDQEAELAISLLVLSSFVPMGMKLAAETIAASMLRFWKLWAFETLSRV
jgi:hypothetical protein